MLPEYPRALLTGTGGHLLRLRRVRKPGHSLICSGPGCLEAVGHGGYFVTLLCRNGLEVHYGLECLENIFKEKARKGLPYKYGAVDGVPDDRPLVPSDLPSNSIESRRLRQERNQETVDILRQVEKRQQGQSLPA